MHARKTARDQYFPSPFDDAFFGARGDVAFKETGDARRFADKVNVRDDRHGATALRPAEIAAMALVHEIFHGILGLYRKGNPQSFDGLRQALGAKLGGGANETLLTFLRTFPTPAIYRSQVTQDGEETPEKYLQRGGREAEDEITEEVILLWLTNQNPAYEPIKPIVSDQDMGPTYQSFTTETQRYFKDDAPSFGPQNQSILDLLLAPSRAAPHSILAQLEYIQGSWAESLGLADLGIWRRVLWARDFLSEENKYFAHRAQGPGPGAPQLDAMRFEERRPEEEPKHFSADLEWMPHVVLIAKTVFVWLDQLSKKYERPIERLDEIPDEELDFLARSGFTGLWLIGLFERSIASKKVKQMRGDADAVASAYSLMRYDIAAELGGYPAYENLKSRAWQRGLRLAADMVPNHVGIDADWVINHPDWFIQTRTPPFPSYRFGGADLSDDPRVGVFIEEGYWTKTDAAVVFRRHDRQTNEDRFIYHGNDGTSMPWNDTAQLDYTKAEVRHAVIETILHVARMFPIIRFDAAMTLAKRHFSRLWFPRPGSGDGIPSRSDYAMTQEEFDRVFPVEFWREVVDTVAARAPDTLLLAEAFWMMEGYFVRTLGMHRVYNSAFMNMLKREENEKYRQTIKNVLDFEPEILKRFVNFMNNPDEETAVAQFGDDDKYFGVCILMCTMPGLPMFGHGQVEGLHEKYGMEYRRPKWDEHPNRWLVERHEREVFPVIKKRYLFSGVAEFSLYDFVTDEGHVDEDVYAYSNGVGGEKAVVLFNNKFKTTRGRIYNSIPTRREDGTSTAPNVVEAMRVGPGEWIRFRDLAKGLEYLRSREELDRGFFFELDAFKYHVFTDFTALEATAEMPWGELAKELSGRGVPSLEKAMVVRKYLPIHAPLRDAFGAPHLAYLATGWDPVTKKPSKAALEALEQRLGYVADGLAYMKPEATIDREVPLAALRKRYADVLKEGVEHAASFAPTMPSIAAPAKKTNGHTKVEVEAGVDSQVDTQRSIAPKDPAREMGTALLLAWAELEAVIDLIAQVDANAKKTRAEIVEEWQLALPLSDSLDSPAHAALVMLGATLPTGTLPEVMAAALEDAAGKAFLGVHDADGTTWLRKESFEELARFLARRDNRTPRDAQDVIVIAEKEGYRADAIAKALAQPPASAPEAPPPVSMPVSATAPTAPAKPAVLKPSS